MGQAGTGATSDEENSIEDMSSSEGVCGVTITIEEQQQQQQQQKITVTPSNHNPRKEANPVIKAYLAIQIHPSNKDTLLAPMMAD